MSEEKVMIYYHNDMDGYFSAATVLKKYPNAKLKACDHGDDVDMVKGYDKVFIVDFSFSKDTMLNLHNILGDRLIVIDHHKTFIEKCFPYTQNKIKDYEIKGERKIFEDPEIDYSDEVWNDIQGYSIKYAISNKGRIKDFDRRVISGEDGRTRFIKGKIRQIHWSDKNYYTSNLKIDNKYAYKTKSIHRLVAENFIPNTENKPCVNHKNGNPKDNRVENLEWVTYKENNIHALKHNLRYPANKKAVAKIDKTGKLLKWYYTLADAAKDNNIEHYGYISRACNNSKPLKTQNNEELNFIWVEDFNNLCFNGLRRLDRAGCGLTWEYMFPDEKEPYVLLLVEDYDIWKFKYIDTKPIGEVLPLYINNPKDVIEYAMLSSTLDESQMFISLIGEGEILIKAKNVRIEKAFKEGVDVTLHNYKCRLCNSNNDASNLGNYCCTKGYDIGIIWSVRRDTIVFSLRSIGDSIDVSSIAKEYLGGGHFNASGFSHPVISTPHVLKALYEQRVK